jgi:type II secretory pathway predicted ATPase ExeA
MYQNHFGFSRALLADGLAQNAAVFASDPHSALISKLAVSLNRRDAVASVDGPAGVGKTTSVTHALREMSTRLALGSIDHPPTTPHDLLEQLLTEFGFTPYKMSRSERLQNWRQFLSEMTVTDTRVVVVAEDADQFDPVVLATLERLTAPNGGGSAGANLVVTARSTSLAFLQAHAVAPLLQRVRLRAHLAPLAEEGLLSYLSFLFGRVGSSIDAVISEAGCKQLHACSQGVLRMINSLLETTMVQAACTGQPRIDETLVRRVAHDFFGIGELTALPIAAAVSICYACHT